MRRDPATGNPDLFSCARDYLHVYMPRVQALSPKTIEAYRISLECFLGYLAETEHMQREHVTFDHFDRQHLKAWLAWMTDHQGYAPKTVTLRLSAVKAFLAYAAQEDITLVALSQAARALKAPAQPRKPLAYLTAPQIRAILAAHTGATTKSRRNRMLLILLYDTAARVSEITSLTLQDLHLDEPGHVTLTGKRNKTRVVPLTGKTIGHLRVYLAEFHPGAARLPATRPLFYSLHDGQPAGCQQTPSPPCSSKLPGPPASNALRYPQTSTATCCARPRPWTFTSKASRSRSSCGCWATKTHGCSSSGVSRPVRRRVCIVPG